ncbi:MAG TPA: CPBP family glutamic-type intramembrane protease [Myxococcota bacterium]|nr:CPBP family glutamic-type intramembrane protease [Myxococcota bacterium]
MIPDHEPEPRPPLTLEFVFTLALLAPLVHLLWFILLVQIGVQLAPSAIGMGAIITYGGLFALSASRFRLPPGRQLAFVRAPASAWLAVLFLAASMVVTSEVDNVVKSLLPPKPVPPHLAEARPYLGEALAIVYIGVFPLAYDLFFRGIFQPLATTRIGVVPGVIATALISGFASAFVPAALSIDLWMLVPALLDALILCILRQSAKSLLPVIALHALWGVAQIGAQYKVFGLAGFDAGGDHTPAIWVGGAALLTAVGLALCRAAARAGSESTSSPARG